MKQPSLISFDQTPEIYLGPPGTGKTETLIKELQKLLDSGVEPESIAYISFTRKAVEEAKSRAAAAFNLPLSRFPFFRTIHSMAFTLMGTSRDQMMQPSHYKQLGNMIGLNLTGAGRDPLDVDNIKQLDDTVLFIENTARVSELPLEDVYKLFMRSMDIRGQSYSINRVRRASEALRKFKLKYDLKDFTDLLEQYAVRGFSPRIKVVFVDEAQDLSRLQWRVVAKIAHHASRLVLAGDDDQAIYQWAGADLQQFIHMPANSTVLDQSYRIPRRVQQVAFRVLRRIKDRREKVWNPRDEDGDVQRHADLGTVPLEEGNWLVIARSQHQLKPLIDHCEMMGFPYSSSKFGGLHKDMVHAMRAWTSLANGKTIDVSSLRKIIKYTNVIPKDRADQMNPQSVVSLESLDMEQYSKYKWFQFLDKISRSEREYARAVLRRKESLTAEPRIRVSTIHGVKGGQADNVMILQDMTEATYTHMMETPDDESRVFYVGVTRTKQNLYIVAPTSRFSFEL